MNWNRITIHHTASRDVSAAVIRHWHLARLFEGRKLGLSRGFTDIGYHFVIRRNGKLEAGRPLTKVGAHVKGKNRGNIGVCLTGNFQKHHPTKNQYSTLRTVLTLLKHAYQISPEEIFLHKDLAPPLCPGKNFNKVEACLQPAGRIQR